MILVNAIYFKGLWTYKFDPKNTTKGLFYSDKTSTTANFMKIEEERLRYANFKKRFGFEAIELPYNSTNISMIIFLPNIGGSLDDLEKKLNKIDMMNISASLRKTKILLEFPKFKALFEINLENQFKEVVI